MKIKLFAIFLLSINQIYSQSPLPRHLEQIVYDTKRNTLILFGGIEITEGKMTEPAYVAEWDNKRWKKIDAPGPGNRRGHGWVYDPSKEASFLFGGVTGMDKEKMLFDVWSWRDNKWTKLSDDCPVKTPQAIYSSPDNTILLYGLANDTASEATGKKFELWEYKSGEWKKLSSEGPVPDGPYELAFHTQRRSVVLPVWNDGKLIVWEWKEGKWFKKNYDNKCPPPRTRFGLAYDEKENSIFLFGGRDTSAKRSSMNDFWKWDGKNWVKIELPIMPPPKATMNLEPANDRLLLYGGSNDGKLTNDIWEWNGKEWREIKL